MQRRTLGSAGVQRAWPEHQVHNLVRRGDKEGEVWPQEASRNVYHQRGPFRGTCVRIFRTGWDIKSEVMSVRVSGGAANQMRVERGASVTMVWRAYNEGGKDFGEGAGLLKAVEMVRDMDVEEVY